MTINVQAAGLQKILSGESAPMMNQEDAKKQGGGNGLTIFAQTTNITSQAIEEKRKEGRARAMDVINDAWDVDKDFDRMVEERQEHYETKKGEWKEAQAQYSALKEQMDELDEQYSDKDSPEYQERMKGLADQAAYFHKQMSDAKGEMDSDQTAIRAIGKERLKKNPMVEAQDNAEKIIEANAKEVMGMAIDAAKEHIDENLEKEEEKAEKVEEKKEEQEEFIEAVREKADEEEERRTEAADTEDLDELLETAVTYDGTKEVQAALDEIRSSMGLLEADLKGLKVDSQG